MAAGSPAQQAGFNGTWPAGMILARIVFMNDMVVAGKFVKQSKN
ncbi:MAG: hypothetical protein ACOYNC_08745 [Bacteroidales bacterium]